MNLYLMRHCEPVPGHPDNAERPLTEAGQKQAEDMAAWLKGHIGRVDIVIHSPFVRAVQTAQAMGKALGAHLADTRLLVPSSENMVDVWNEITRLAQASKDVLVVGHDPSLNALLMWLISAGENEFNDAVRLEWGSIAWLKVPVFGALQWLVTPLIVLADKEVVEAAEALAESLSRL